MKIVSTSNLEGQIPEKKYGKFLITGNGDETQELWKPLLNTIPAFRGSAEWFAGTEFGIFLFWNLSTQPNYFSTEKRQI